MILTSDKGDHEFIANGEFRSIVDENSIMIKNQYKLGDRDTYDESNGPYYEVRINTIIRETEDNSKIVRYDIVEVNNDQRKVITLSEFLSKSGLAHTCFNIRRKKTSICKKITNYICDREKLEYRFSFSLICIMLCFIVVYAVWSFIDDIKHR